jgi:hypothetical protein
MLLLTIELYEDGEYARNFQLKFLLLHLMVLRNDNLYSRGSH